MSNGQVVIMGLAECGIRLSLLSPLIFVRIFLACFPSLRSPLSILKNIPENNFKKGTEQNLCNLL